MITTFMTEGRTEMPAFWIEITKGDALNRMNGLVCAWKGAPKDCGNDVEENRMIPRLQATAPTGEPSLKTWAQVEPRKEGEGDILGVSAASAIEKPGVVVRDESADNQ
jgi:hypothetical protein